MIVIGAKLLDDDAVNQAKITGIMRQRNAAEPGDHPIKRAPDSVENKVLLALAADAVYDVVSLLPIGQELGDEFGRVLQVGVDLHRDIALGVKIICQNR